MSERDNVRRIRNYGESPDARRKFIRDNKHLATVSPRELRAQNRGYASRSVFVCPGIPGSNEDSEKE